MFGRRSKLRTARPSKRATIGGSTYSYYSGARGVNDYPNEARNPNKTKVFKLKKILAYGPTFLAVVAIVIGLGYSLMINPNPKIIRDQNVSDLFLQDINTYQSAANKLFSQSLFNRNKITVDISGITEHLKKQFPELAQVSITLPLVSHRPLVYITPSQPSMILESGQGHYVLNESGIAVMSTDTASNLADLNLPRVKDQSIIVVQVGQPALTTKEVSFVIEVTRQFKAKNQAILELILPHSANELDVKVKGKPYIIKFNTLGDPKEQAGMYFAAYKRLSSRGQLPAKYFDVRVDGRIYYR